MTDFLAVAGFWAFMILGLVRMTRRKGAAPGELEELRGRVRQLEHTVGTLQGQVGELHEGHDFTLKLLKEPAKTEA
jgi:hypothetical protein